MHVAVLEAAGLLADGEREHGLEQQAPGLLEVLEGEALEVPTAVLEDEDDIELVLREDADVVVLRLVLLVPQLPLAHQGFGVRAPAHAEAVHLDEARREVRRRGARRRLGPGQVG